jgi:hypothetical protein
VTPTDAHRPDQDRDPSMLDLELDRLSLEQALVDFELANQRAMDFAARLVESDRRVGELQAQVDELHRQIHEIHGTRTYKLARSVWYVRRALRG